MIAIMQPTFLPWLGYFDLIDQADLFIFLDNVQFSRQSWQQRNRITTQRGLEWITVPVKGGSSKEQIVDVRLSSDLKKIIDKIENTYRNHPFFKMYWPDFKEILAVQMAGDSLSTLNIHLIKAISSMLGINASFMTSSTIRTSDHKINRLIDIIKFTRSNQYLSPIGASEYLLHQLDQFSENKIDIKFQNYNHPNYKLEKFPYCEKASIIDLIFTHGLMSVEIIRSGRSVPLSLRA